MSINKFKIGRLKILRLFQLSAPAANTLGTLVIAFGWFWGCSAMSRTAPGDGSQGELQRALYGEAVTPGSEEDYEIPASSEAHYEYILGELAFKQEDFDGATRHLKAAAKIDNTPAPTLRKRLAQLYVRSGKLDDALEQINLAQAADQDDIELLQLRAGILATLKKSDEAIETYRKVIELSGPDNEEPYVFIASLYVQQNNLPAGEEVLKDLLQKNPDSFFGHYYIAKIYLGETKYDLAEKHYKRALELSPGAEPVQVELARVYALQKRFEEAIKLSEKVVEQNPANVKARTLLGELLLGKDRLDEALKEFEAIRELEEDPSDTRFKIALIKLQRRDLDGAELELRLILAQHPENSGARYYLASAYAAMKRTDDAIEQLKAIEPGQDFFQESKTLGAYLLRQRDRFSEAVDMLDELLKEKSDDTKLLQFKASLQRDGKDLDGAVATTKKLLELEPNNDQNYFNLGVYYDELTREEEAHAAMRKAIELNPKNSNALNFLGYTLAEKGHDLHEAETLVKQAIELEPTNGYFIDSLGWVYFKMGRLDDALRELQRSVALVPNDAVILEHLGLIYVQMKDETNARDTLKRALTHAADSEDKGAATRIEKALQDLGAGAKAE